jgi:hypothetical protein
VDAAIGRVEIGAVNSHPVPSLPRNSSRPFVPPGVDAKSWLGFEQRIQRRRFQALVVAAQRAISVGDGDAARAALREARELRPRTAELDALEQQLGARVARRPAERPLWRRASGAVALMAVGTGLLIAVDGPRMPGTIPGVPAAPPVHVRTLGDSTFVSTGHGTTGLDWEMPAIGVAPPPDVVRVVADAPAASRRLAAGEVPDDYVSPTRPRGGGDVTAPAASPAPVAVRPSPAAPRNEWPLSTAETVLAAPALRAVPSSVLPPVAYPPAAPAAAPGAPAAAPAAPAAATARPASSVEEGRVTAALDQYARAYGRLDASAARAVWPSVNERALSNAFAGLASQALDFKDCSIDVRGSAAHAVCRGTASYVPRVGSDRPRIEPRTWRFELRRDGDAWTIADAVAQR